VPPLIDGGYIAFSKGSFQAIAQMPEPTKSSSFND